MMIREIRINAKGTIKIANGEPILTFIGVDDEYYSSHDTPTGELSVKSKLVGLAVETDPVGNDFTIPPSTNSFRYHSLENATDAGSVEYHRIGSLVRYAKPMEMLENPEVYRVRFVFDVQLSLSDTMKIKEHLLSTKRDYSAEMKEQVSEVTEKVREGQAVDKYLEEFVLGKK